MVTWHLTMKLFPAKCHERATLRKLWRQTGNSSLLPAKCWRLLHVIVGISARFSNFSFVLFCYITNHLMAGPLGNNEFCFPRISMFPSTSSRETLRFSGNKIHCSPRDQSVTVYCFHTKSSSYIAKNGFSVCISLIKFTFAAQNIALSLQPPGWHASKLLFTLLSSCPKRPAIPIKLRT